MEGASTDLGRRIRELVVDVPGGREVDLEWEDLDRVVFAAAPSGARASSGRLYGTVEDSEGRLFTGYVSYDWDEILEADVLDGRDTETGDDLDIRWNDALTSLDGLFSLTYFGNDLIIEYNSALCRSLIDAFVAWAPVSGNILGIYNNDDSC